MDWQIVGGVLAGLAAVAAVGRATAEAVTWVRRRRQESPDVREDGGSLEKLSPEGLRHNLPHRRPFVGRVSQVEDLTEVLAFEAGVVSVTGPGGIGKTSLVLEVAHRLVEQCAVGASNRPLDAIVWVSGRDQPLTADGVFDVICRILGYPAIVRQGVRDKKTSVERVLRRTRCLLVLDNVQTSVDPMLEDFYETVPEPSRVLLTTRQRAADVERAVTVGRLTPEEATQLIRAVADRLGLDLGPELEQDLRELAAAAGGSPLAIKWALGQVKARGQTIESVIEHLKSAEGDLFESIFKDSWASLSRESRLVLNSMLVFVAPASRSALEAASGLSKNGLARALGDLMHYCLVEDNALLSEETQRFGLHPLTRAFVTAQLHGGGDDQARRRLALYYTELCRERGRYGQGRRGHDDLEADLENVWATVNWCYETWRIAPHDRALADAVIQVADALSVFLWTRGYWHRRIVLGRFAVDVGRTLEWLEAAGRHAYYVGIVHVWQGDIEEARKWAEESVAFMTSSADALQSTIPRRLMALVAMREGQFSEAHDLLMSTLKVLERHLEAGGDVGMFADWYSEGPRAHERGLVSIFQELGIVSLAEHLTAPDSKPRLADARSWLEHSLVRANDIGDVEGRSVSLSHLGRVALAEHELESAAALFRQALADAKKTSRASTAGRAYLGLAMVGDELGWPEAPQYCCEARNIFERLGMRDELNQATAVLASMGAGSVA